MEKHLRKPFQGILNIIRFNWHFYVLAFVLIACLFTITVLFPSQLNWIYYLIIAGVTLGTTLSLIASYYIYDYSNLYSLNWLDDFEVKQGSELLNINAGFDETSYLLKQKYANCNLAAMDFYNPAKHTEVSIERARKAYLPYPSTMQIETTNIGLSPKSIDCVFIILAAHEIRDKQEQIIFFKQMKQALRADGKIIVVEHNRDIYNFLVYNLGCFHFFSQRRWKEVFRNSELVLIKTKKTTPFINVYYLT
ncbi:methyltransferase [Pedobacter frigiditerrae]|uniref:methyltransferase n=1 Tax=Pedobacter frigiditerrae TaxID=2530452 RepID=UPI00293105F4|nr:methyltransferase [Pedobacter frigiditerrae]